MATPQITDTEREVLEALWECEPTSIRPLLDRLRASGREWAYTTLHTLLSRLADKGCVAVDRTGFAHVYRAAVTRESMLRRGLRDLADRWCSGAPTPLLVHLLGDSELSREDIEHFRQMLARRLEQQESPPPADVDPETR